MATVVTQLGGQNHKYSIIHIWVFVFVPPTYIWPSCIHTAFLYNIEKEDAPCVLAWDIWIRINSPGLPYEKVGDARRTA